MDKDDDGKIILYATFGVRSDKNRGILIETITVRNNVYFFKFHDQPLARHCEQMQSVIRKADVKRSKNVVIDIASFSHEYLFKDKVSFRGTVLNSVNSQIGKACNTAINKEVGALKRSITMAANKPKRVESNNDKILLKMRGAEAFFQYERARRIHELYAGPATQSENLQSGQSGNLQSGSEIGAEPHHTQVQSGPSHGGLIERRPEVGEDVDLPSDDDDEL